MITKGKAADYRLLIIDDNEAIHTDLKKILMPATDLPELVEDEALLFGASVAPAVGFEIDSAFQGQEGLACLETALSAGRPYSLAFVDLRMPPGWDGIETISWLWKRDPDLQIVICTAYSDYDWQDIQRRLGLSHNLVILKKPFDPIEVTQLAHALTAKWASTRQSQLHLEELDQLVAERTRQLRTAMQELQKAKELAEYAALQDPLTKLPNRRLFQERVAQALQQAERSPDYFFAVLYLDVDRFKVINDSLGHMAGDELLVQVGIRLQESLRQQPVLQPQPHGGDIVARLGGDEFAIFLDDVCDVSDALRVARQIQHHLSASLDLRGRDVTISASIGVTTSASRYTSGENMLRDADIAMYRAKAGGRGGCVLFDESMHSHAVERLQKEAELRQALEREEFFLCYQPIVALANGQITGFEALLRWRSPTRGLVGPADFIPLTEETGLIVPIGSWALREACGQMKRWCERFGPDFPLSVSVNLSARQFVQTDLVNIIAGTLSDAGISGRSLRLELTESVAMEEPERAAPMLAQLQELGVRVSVDDFGTGYSSLNYLHRFSVDTLKIDCYFISNMGTDQRNANIVRTIVSLAHNLGMEVVAEGAETAEQVNLLTDMKCDAVQGYYFSRPLTASHAEQLLASAPGFRIVFAKGVGRC